MSATEIAARCDRHVGEPYPPPHCRDCDALAEDVVPVVAPVDRHGECARHRGYPSSPSAPCRRCLDDEPIEVVRHPAGFPIGRPVSTMTAAEQRAFYFHQSGRWQAVADQRLRAIRRARVALSEADVATADAVLGRAVPVHLLDASDPPLTTTEGDIAP